MAANGPSRVIPVEQEWYTTEGGHVRIRLSDGRLHDDAVMVDLPLNHGVQELFSDILQCVPRGGV
jgi:hypothetical protein